MNCIKTPFLLLALLSVCLLAACSSDCEEKTWYIDADGDGFGSQVETVQDCDQPTGFVDNADDIDDNDSRLNPNTAWTGEQITFTKDNNADWTLAENQDRLTDNVWLTRQDNRSLFNIRVETEQTGSYSTTLAPTGTEWAFGSISDGLDNLIFDRFVGTLNNNVGDFILSGPLVLHLIEDDIYIDIQFTSWASGNSGGGYSYIRSTN